MPEIQLSSTAAQIDATVGSNAFIVETTGNIEDIVTEIVRYMRIRDDMLLFKGWALDTTIPSTQIRPILQRKYHVKLTAQCIDTVTKKVFYASVVLAATHLAELDANTPNGTFYKSNGTVTTGDVTYQIVGGGVVVRATGNIVIVVIKGS